MRDDQVQVDFYQRMRASIAPGSSARARASNTPTTCLPPGPLPPPLPAGSRPRRARRPKGQAGRAHHLLYRAAGLDSRSPARPYGYVDDLVAAALVLNGLVNEIDPRSSSAIGQAARIS